MEIFLNEYGLKWRGYGKPNQDNKLSKDNLEKVKELKK